MGQLLLAFALGFASFAATSFDNLLLLVGFLGNPNWTRRIVAQAYTGAILGVVLVSLLLSEVARYGPLEGRGLVLLGFLPIGLGLYYAVRLLLSGRQVAQERMQDTLSRTMELRRGRSAVIAVTLAASGDSLAAYTALFADTATWLVPMTAAGILCGAVGWTFIAASVMRREGARRVIERIAPVALPVLLIALGLYILGDSPTDVTVPAR
jgi:cadmium resistance protein CadD (predicted permease)